MRYLRLLLRSLVILVLLLVLTFFGGGLLLPKSSTVSRSIDIARSPHHVHAVLEDVGRFNDWSPWYDRDPNARYVFTDSRRGVGAGLSWEGDPATVGSGRQTIVASERPGLVRVQLDFGSMGQPVAEHRIEAIEGGSRVTWTLQSQYQGWSLNSFVQRWFGLFLDRLVGPDYETGLGRLKALVETLPPDDFARLEVDVLRTYGITALLVDSQAASSDPADVGPAIAAGLVELRQVLADLGLEQLGPLALIERAGEADWHFTLALPVASGAGQPLAPIRLGSLPAGVHLVVEHEGGYDTLADAARALRSYAAAHGIEVEGLPWFEFLPGEPARTRIHLRLPADARG